MTRWLDKAVRLRSPYAPNFIVRAANFRPEVLADYPAVPNALGKGFSEEVARVRMWGEAAERISVRMASSESAWPALFSPPSEPQHINVSEVFPKAHPRSHGCAAHNQISQAATAALFELWERRLVSGWWQGDYGVQRVPAEAAEARALEAFTAFARTGAIVARTTEFYVIDGLSPVVVTLALSFDHQRSQMAVGFAAGSTLMTTLKRAFEELLVAELEVSDLHGGTLKGEAITPGSPRDTVAQRQKALRSRFETPSLANPFTALEPVPSATSVAELLSESEALGATVLVADMTSAEIGIPVCRAMFRTPEFNEFFSKADGVPPV